MTRATAFARRRGRDVANLSADLLGIGPVPDSLWNADRALRLH